VFEPRILVISDSVRKRRGGESRQYSGRTIPGPAQSKIKPMTRLAPKRVQVFHSAQFSRVNSGVVESDPKVLSYRGVTYV